MFLDDTELAELDQAEELFELDTEELLEGLLYAIRAHINVLPEYGKYVDDFIEDRLLTPRYTKSERSKRRMQDNAARKRMQDVLRALDEHDHDGRGVAREAGNFYCVYALLKAIDLVWMLRTNYKGNRDPAFFHLGVLWGKAQGMQKLTSAYVDGKFDRAKGIAIARRRYATRKATYADAAGLAEKLWLENEEGCPDAHGKMADYLLTLDDYAHLKRRTLLAALRPAAKQHGRYHNPRGKSPKR